MIRKMVYFISALWLSAPAGSNATQPIQEETEGLTVRFATGQIKPYQMENSKGELTGTAIPIIKCTMNKLGNSYSIDLLPWARAQKNVEIGEHDAFFVASKNKARDAYAVASEPMFNGARSWVLRSGMAIDPASDLSKQNIHVGAVFGTNMHSYLKRSYQNVITKKDEISLIELLQASRVDAVLMTNAMFRHLISEHKIDASAFKTQEASQHPLGVYFGHHFLKQKPDFVSRFNQALKHCLPANNT